MQKLHTLKLSLASPRARRRTETQVQEAVDKILADYEVVYLMDVRITSREKDSFRQARRGRPNHKTRYKPDVAVRFDLEFEASLERMAQDRVSVGVFPLVSNGLKLSEIELLCADKNQPQIEKRFSQLKTDFAVAPVHSQSPTRIVVPVRVLLCAVARGPAGTRAASKDDQDQDQLAATVSRRASLPTTNHPAST